MPTFKFFWLRFPIFSYRSERVRFHFKNAKKNCQTPKKFFCWSETFFDPLFRSGKWPKLNPPFFLHNFPPMPLKFLQRVEEWWTLIRLSQIFDICCLPDILDEIVSDTVFTPKCRENVYNILINALQVHHFGIWQSSLPLCTLSLCTENCVSATNLFVWEQISDVIQFFRIV